MSDPKQLTDHELRDAIKAASFVVQRCSPGRGLIQACDRLGKLMEEHDRRQAITHRWEFSR